MFQRVHHRGVRYFAIIVFASILTLPQIGRITLWDDDEVLNAEAAREMFEADAWIVPTFNFRLRDAKPALLYWCQIASYHAFGVNEFAARFPSAVAYILLGLFTYELGRRMYSAMAGFAAAIILLTAGVVVWLGGFATHDAILLACTALTFLCFWTGYAPRHSEERPRGSWFIPVGIACGFGTLAKGPIAIVLPATVILLYLTWQRQLSLLWNRRLLYGLAAFCLVAAPWYILVTVATRGAFAQGFFITNNLRRLHTPMEMHGGSIFYHPLVLLVGFAPWSVLFVPAICSVVQQWRARTEDSVNQSTSARRLLICWIVVYLAFFTIAATKLPHYTAPLYPALAILLAQWLARWWRREVHVPRWSFAFGFGLLALAGLAVSAGMFWIGRHRSLPIDSFPLLAWSWIGLPAFLIGVVAIAGVYRDHRKAVLCSFAICHALDLLVIAHVLTPTLDRCKPARRLVEQAGARQPHREIRLASFQYTQPGLVFYSKREVTQLQSETQTAEFLSGPLAAYLFISEENWIRLESQLPDAGAYVAARVFDPFRGKYVVVVSNRPASDEFVVQRQGN